MLVVVVDILPIRGLERIMNIDEMWVLTFRFFFYIYLYVKRQFVHNCIEIVYE